MKKIRTIVVDDEPLARTRITNLLKSFDFIDLIGEGKNGRQALQMLTNYKPDLVFLDIQMPDLNGFDVLSNTAPEDLPFIIFVTAYDQYALKAFDVHAVDYLLKPFDDDRFAQALDHARQQIETRQHAMLHHRIVRMLEDHQDPQGESIHSIEVKERGIAHRIKIDDIHFFEAHGNYLKAHIKDRFFLIRQTLQSLTEQISLDHYLRIHRSVLINCNYIDKITYRGNNQFAFLMKNSKEVLSSRSYREDIERILDDEFIRRISDL